MAAGPAAAIERCIPVLDALGQGTIVVGTSPAQANVVKVAGNFILASAIASIGEAFALVRKYGIEPERFLEIINEKVVRSPVYQNYGTLIATEHFEPAGFRLRHGLKDLRLALQAADEVSVPLPLASLLHDQFVSAMARGWADIDWSGVAKSERGQCRPRGGRQGARMNGTGHSASRSLGAIAVAGLLAVHGSAVRPGTADVRVPPSPGGWPSSMA